MVLFKCTWNRELDKKIGYVELTDGEIEALSDFITDSSLVNSLVDFFWNNMEYESIDVDKIVKYIDKKM